LSSFYTTRTHRLLFPFPTRRSSDLRPGMDVPAERHPDHRGAGADGERPQPADLHRRAAPLIRCLHIDRLAAAAAEPPAHRRALGPQLARLLLSAAGARLLLAHSFSLSSAGTLMCLGSTSPSGSAAANAESWDP